MSKSLADKFREFDRVLSASDVESVMSLPIKTVYDWAKSGRIPSFKMGAKVCFDPFQLADWYEQIAVVSGSRK